MGPTNAKTNYENKCEKMRYRTYFYVGNTRNSAKSAYVAKISLNDTGIFRNT